MIYAIHEDHRVKGVVAATRLVPGQVIERVPLVRLQDAEWQYLSRTLLKGRCRRSGERAVFCFGFVSLYRVSASPNAALRWGVEQDRGDVVALGEIEVGQEILLGRDEAPPPAMSVEQLPVQQNAPSPATDWLARTSDVALALVRVPAGEFLMGTGERDPQAYWLIENPQFRLHLDEYRIARYPTTVAQFAAFVHATGYRAEAEARGRSWTFSGREWEEMDGADWRHPRGPLPSIAQK